MHLWIPSEIKSVQIGFSRRLRSPALAFPVQLSRDELLFLWFNAPNLHHQLIPESIMLKTDWTQRDAEAETDSPIARQ